MQWRERGKTFELGAQKCHRRLGALAPLERSRFPAEQPRIVGRNPEPALGRLTGGVEVVRSVERQCEVEVAPRSAGVERDAAPELGNRPLQAGANQEDLAEVVVRPGIRRREDDRAARGGLGLVVAPEFAQRHRVQRVQGRALAVE